MNRSTPLIVFSCLLLTSATAASDVNRTSNGKPDFTGVYDSGPVNGLGGADENLHVVERFNLREDGHIVYGFTVTDPTAWTAPQGSED